jgi:hypothetical protein
MNPSFTGKLSEGVIFLNILKYPRESQDAKGWLTRHTTTGADIAKKLYNRDTLAPALRMVLEVNSRCRRVDMIFTAS